MPLPQALEYFADDMDDASADLVIASLILNARLRGPGLREVLGALAKSSREEVDMRQRVMAQRSSTRRSVQIVVFVSVAVVLGLAVFNKSFVEPYNTVTGQFVLVGVIGLFAAGFFWLRRLSTVETPARFLQRARGGQVPEQRGEPR
jgi:Flp pilus assembly protein TadB